MGVTKVSNDAEEVGLQSFPPNVSVLVNLFDTKLSRALTILEGLEDGGARDFLKVFARSKSGGKLEQGSASCR